MQLTKLKKKSMFTKNTHFQSTCLRFVPHDGSDSLPRMDIVAENLGGLCYTSWNTDGAGNTYAEVTLTPNSGCTMPRTITHEIMHGVSYYHTHKREDRDSVVTIHWENIQPNLQQEFEFCTGCCCETHGKKDQI